ERPWQFGVDPLPAFNVQDFGNLQKLHACIHHHRLHAGGGDLESEFVENDMMNHEAKANRRFRERAQVRIHCPEEKRDTNRLITPPVEIWASRSSGAAALFKCALAVRVQCE